MRVHFILSCGLLPFPCQDTGNLSWFHRWPHTFNPTNEQNSSTEKGEDITCATFSINDQGILNSIPTAEMHLFQRRLMCGWMDRLSLSNMRCCTSQVASWKDTHLTFQYYGDIFTSKMIQFILLNRWSHTTSGLGSLRHSSRQVKWLPFSALSITFHCDKSYGFQLSYFIGKFSVN